MTRKILVALLPLVPISLYVTWVLLLDQAGLLPRPLITHWGTSGQPDGFAGLPGHFLGAAIAFSIPTVLWVAGVLSPKLHQSLRRLLLLVATGVAVLVFGLMVFFIAIQIGPKEVAEVNVGYAFYFVFLPIFLSLVFFFLGKPEIVVGENLKIKIRGITFLQLDFKDIESVFETEVSWKEFGGLGLRFRKNKVAFIPSSGACVGIRTVSGQEIFIRTNNVEIAKSLIAPKI